MRRETILQPIICGASRLPRSKVTKRLFLGLILLAACRNDTSGIDSQRSMLAFGGSGGSGWNPNGFIPTLAQALDGKIKPAGGAGQTIVASTAGAPSVGADGTASYVIPLWVPEGMAGL